MRMDVKVGLFVGIAALLLTGWVFWPGKPAQKATQTIEIGGRDATAADRPVVRPGQSTGSSRESAVPPSTVADTSAPKVPLGTTPAAPVPTPRSSGVAAPGEQAAASVAPNAAPVAMAPVTPPAEPTIPSADARPATAQPAGPAAIGREPLIHVVRAGDTLEKIAQMYYGQPSLAGALRQANPQLGGKSLRAGIKVKVPAEADLPRLTQAPSAPAADTSLAVHVDTGTTAMTAGPSTQPAGVMALGPQDYKVQKGDTLYSIARKQLGSGKRFQELLELNTQMLGGKPSGLRPGQILHLPAK